MARKARLVCSQRPTHYVVSNRLAGDPQAGLLADEWSRNQFETTLRHFASIYTVRILTCAIGANGFRLLLEVNPQQRLSHAELERRQGKLDRRQRTPLTRKEARLLRKRLGSLSDFMRDVGGVWARRYNRARGRRGPVWADRFHSVMLGGGMAVEAAYLYVEQQVEGWKTPEEAASGWDRSWRREDRERLRWLWLRRRWREVLPVWEWGRAVGERHFVEWCAARDRPHCRWEVAALGVKDLWSLRPAGRQARSSRPSRPASVRR